MYTPNEREKAVAKIGDHSSWPGWPSLPMKRRIDSGIGMEFGEIIPDFPLIVFMAPFPHRLSTVAIGALSVSNPGEGEIWEKIAHKQYIDFDQMFDDGWMID